MGWTYIFPFMIILFVALLGESFHVSAQGNAQGAVSPNPCPPGWIKHSQSCYFFSKDKEPWALASAHCTALGSHLVRITSANEDRFVKTTLRARKPFKYIWIDGTDIAKEGYWVYGKSQTPFVYTGWKKGSPNQWRDQDCLFMDARHGYEWNDAECHRSYPFVCERDSSF